MALKVVTSRRKCRPWLRTHFSPVHHTDHGTNTTPGSKRGKRVSKRLEGLGDVAPIVIGGSCKTLKTAFNPFWQQLFCTKLIGDVFVAVAFLGVFVLVMSFTSEMCLAMLSVICCFFRYCGDMFQFYVQVSVLWSHLYVFILEKSTQDIKCSICSIMFFSCFVFTEFRCIQSNRPNRLSSLFFLVYRFCSLISLKKPIMVFGIAILFLPST